MNHHKKFAMILTGLGKCFRSIGNENKSMEWFQKCITQYPKF